MNIIEKNKTENKTKLKNNKTNNVKLNFLFFSVCIFLSLFIQISLANGIIYISEIDFAGYEAIEIYSDTRLNLSSKLFYDDVGI